MSIEEMIDYRSSHNAQGSPRLPAKSDDHGGAALSDEPTRGAQQPSPSPSQAEDEAHTPLRARRASTTLATQVQTAARSTKTNEGQRLKLPFGGFMHLRGTQVIPQTPVRRRRVPEPPSKLQAPREIPVRSPSEPPGIVQPPGKLSCAALTTKRRAPGEWAASDGLPRTPVRRQPPGTISPSQPMTAPPVMAKRGEEQMAVAYQPYVVQRYELQEEEEPQTPVRTRPRARARQPNNPPPDAGVVQQVRSQGHFNSTRIQSVKQAKGLQKRGQPRQAPNRKAGVSAEQQLARRVTQDMVDLHNAAAEIREFAEELKNEVEDLRKTVELTAVRRKIIEEVVVWMESRAEQVVDGGDLEVLE